MLKKVLGGLALALLTASANASLMDIHFTASGSATGFGDAIVDSSMLAPGAYNCCGTPPPDFLSLNLNLNFGAGVTTFHLADLSGTSYILNVGSSGIINDINFWGHNADGVNLTGISPFHDAASGALGANGTVVYSVTSVTSAVPEPTTVALLGLGLLGFGVARRRKQ